MDRVFRGKISERGIVELKDLVDLFHLLLRSGVADSLQRLRLLKDHQFVVLGKKMFRQVILPYLFLQPLIFADLLAFAKRG